MADSSPATLRYAVTFAIGLLLMGYAGQTYFWHGYMLANPAVGTPSTSTGFSVVLLGMFLLGAITVYTAFMHGLARVR